MKKSILSACSVAFVASVLGILGGAEGCSSSKPESPPDAAHIASYFASAYCGALSGCCDKAKVAYDGSSCEAQMTSLFQVEADTVKRGKVIYDASAAAACADAMRAREARCSDDDAGPPPTADAGFVDAIQIACWGVYKGTVQPGQPCETDTECASDGPSTLVSCMSDPVSHTGTQPGTNDRVCVQYHPHQPLGSACSAGGIGDTYIYRGCERTLGYCDASADPQMRVGVCTALPAVGASCQASHAECAPGAYCDATNRCVPLAAAGSPCGINGAFACATGLYCDHDSEKCEASRDPGATCTYDAQCATSLCHSETLAGGGRGPSVCADASYGPYDISPRTCGFGPYGKGSEDGGILPPAKAQSMRFRPAPDLR